MVYELRAWSHDAECLYTDDQRAKDLASQSPRLRVVGTYFRTLRESQPFAWDIVGSRDELNGITQALTPAGRRAR